MKKEIPCPECNYPMDTSLVRKGGPYIAKIENFVCPSCNYSERKPSVTEKMKLEGEFRNLKIQKKI